MTSYSLWSVKKLPIQEAVQFIRSHSTIQLQAQITGQSIEEYEQLSSSDAYEKLLHAISTMSEESYDEFLLEIIDE